MAICNNKKYERDFVKLMTKLGLDCHRVAGSGSAEDAVCDCILFYNQRTYLVEVKATKEKVLYMRKGVREQLQKMITVCERNGLIPLLAIKFKQRGWNVLEVKSFQNIAFKKEDKIDETSREDFKIT